MVIIGESGCSRAKVVVFLQKWLYSGYHDCIGTKWLHFGKSGCIRAKWLYSDKNGCIWDEWFDSGINGCIREKIFIFGQFFLNSGKTLYYSDKVVVFLQN